MLRTLDQMLEAERWSDALRLAETLLRRKENSARDLMLVHRALLEARHKLRQHEGAVSAGMVAMTLAKELEEWDYHGEIIVTLGIASSWIKDRSSAYHWWSEYLSNLHRYRSSAKHEAVICYNLGVHHTLEQEYDQAESFLVRALRTATSQGRERMAHGTRHALINVYLKVGAIQQVPQLMVRCQHYLRNTPESDDTQESRLWNRKLWVEYLIATGRLARAWRIASKEAAACTDRPRHQLNFHMLLAEIKRREGLPEEALAHASAAKALAITCRRKDLEAEVLDLIYRLALRREESP